MLKIDLHTHSIASGHAFNTIYELAQAASEKGAELIAITDHGPNMIGSAHLEYFSMAKRVPKELFGVKILFGCEANIIDHEGTLDIPIEYLKSLDIVLIGFHKLTDYPKDSTRDENTIAMIKAIEKYPVNIIAHPYRLDFPIIVEEVSKVTLLHNTLLEINNSIFGTTEYNPNDELILETRKMITVSKQNGGKLIVGSDAHIASEVGDDSNILKYWKTLELDNSLFISSVNQLREFVNIAKE